MTENSEMIRTIKQEMASLSGRAASAKARVLAKQLNIDVSRVYHHSRDVRPARNRRADHGKPRKIDEQTFETLAWYTANLDFSSQQFQSLF